MLNLFVHRVTTEFQINMGVYGVGVTHFFFASDAGMHADSLAEPADCIQWCIISSKFVVKLT